VHLESTFDSVDVSCPDGLRDGVSDDWSSNRICSVTELSMIPVCWESVGHYTDWRLIQSTSICVHCNCYVL